MLRELIEAWKGEDLQSMMLDEFDKMLEAAQWMFENACELLVNPEKVEEVQDEMSRRDREIKQREATIRRQLIEHLAIRPGRDATGALIMMSVVKDAERIGDYARNIFKLRTLYTRKFKHGRYTKPIEEIRDAIRDIFVKVRQAFLQGNVELAEEVVSVEDEISAKCDDIIGRLLSDEAIRTDRAVAYTLLARFLNRSAAHLDNIATTVLRPAHLIDLPSDDAAAEDPPKDPAPEGDAQESTG